MNKFYKKQKGFTLIETLLYLSLSSIMILVIASFWGTLIESRDRSESMSIVNSEGTYLVNSIAQIIRNADSITSPTATNSAGAITMTTFVPAESPTVIALSGSNINLTLGAGAPVQLNSTRTIINSLVFRNVSNTSTAGSVRIELSLSYNNTSGKASLNYTQTYYATATLK